MPRPRGWSQADKELRDKCVESLLEKGVPGGRTAEERARGPRQRAFAICTTSVERHRRTGNPGTVEALMEAARRLWLALPLPK